MNLSARCLPVGRDVVAIAATTLCLLWGGTAGGRDWLSGVFTPPSPQTPHPAVVRIVAPDPTGFSLGSGSLIDIRDGYGLVVTNWHVVRDATGPIDVRFPSGDRVEGVVRKVDSDWDLAAVSISAPRGATPLRIARQVPQPGESLTIAGYGSGSYRSATGRCMQYLAPSQSHPFEMVEVDVAARQGDSGGPILNASGELAGVLFGEGGGSTSGSHSGRLRQFLADVLPQESASGRAPLDDAVATADPLESRRWAAEASADPFAELDGVARREDDHRTNQPPFRASPWRAVGHGDSPARISSPETAGEPFAPRRRKSAPAATLASKEIAPRRFPDDSQPSGAAEAATFDWAALVMRIGVVFAGLLVLRSLTGGTSAAKKS